MLGVVLSVLIAQLVAPVALRAFPKNFAPLASNVAAAPSGERLSTATGHTDAFSYAHGRGVVAAPLARVWKALREPAVLVDRRRIDTFRVVTNDQHEGEGRIVIHNTVHAFLTVDFDYEWRFALVEGTPEAPTVVAARAVKTDGTEFISRLEDSVVLRKVDEQTTSVEFVRQIKAMRMGEDDARLFLEDLFASLVAQTRGEKLPTF